MFPARVPRRFDLPHARHRRPSLASELTGVMGLPADAAPADVSAIPRAGVDAPTASAAPTPTAKARRLRPLSTVRRRLKGRPPRDLRGTLDPVSEADQMRALAFMVAAKLATIFVPIAGLAAVVVARVS